MNYTTYYKLQKPLGTEKYDIEVHNANSDVIDSALSYLQDKNREQSSTLSDVLSKINTHETDNTVHISVSEREAWNEAKNHAGSIHARTDATKTEASETNGNIKINGVEANVYTHPNGTNPHGTTKSDVGLGDVENKSSAAIRNELTKENVTNALGYVPYTPNEVDNKFSALETKIPKATREMDGLLSKEDKAKYDDALTEMRNQYATKEELNALSDVVGQANALLESI